jgi:hypothetical protein
MSPSAVLVIGVQSGHAEKGPIIMNKSIIVLEQNEDDLFVNKISDEALEVAAGAAQTANYTLGSCTGGTTCPPWTPV